MLMALEYSQESRKALDQLESRISAEVPMIAGAVVDMAQLVRVTEVDDLSQEIALAFLDVDSESHELMQEHLPEHEESEA